MMTNQNLNHLDLKANGYGSNYLIDLQETFFEMKLSNYTPEKIDKIINFVEEKSFNSMNQLFKFCCSLGEEGKPTSTILSFYH